MIQTTSHTSIFLIGNKDYHICVNPNDENGKGIFEVTKNGSIYERYELTKPLEKGKWTGFGLVYNEDDINGKVSLFIDGEKVLNNKDIGFKLSELDIVDASIGTTYETGFLRKGKYDNILFSMNRSLMMKLF